MADPDIFRNRVTEDSFKWPLNVFLPAHVLELTQPFRQHFRPSQHISYGAFPFSHMFLVSLYPSHCLHDLAADWPYKKQGVMYDFIEDDS